MKKKPLIVTVMLLAGLLFFGMVWAAQQADDVMTMNSKVYAKHKKALVTLNHKKHNVDYKIGCSDCHHVFKDGKNVWKEGDAVQKCEACHDQAKAPTGKDAPKLSKSEKIQKFHYSAIHANCAGCHKANKKAGKKNPGPAACKECHPKK